MRTIILLLALLIASPALAVQIEVTVPNAAVARAQELCEILRVETRYPTADWSNSICLSIMVYRGMRNFEHKAAKEAGRQAGRVTVRNALINFDANYPSTVTRGSFCGDGDVDTEFGEQCDDGNQDDGDGCSSGCLTE